jgi:serine/threonine protein kinase/DNA-binding beta-propeller fold protein YncE/tetratricopeptide (TPR) repeat protein
MEKGANSTDKRVRLGDFIIEKKVGEGGMGTVFMARQISLDRVVALKILPKSFADNPEFVERFRREARAAASLIHPNVVQVYSVGEERGVPYFAMEFVEGDTLEAAIKSGNRYGIRAAVELAAGVARALEAAHEKGLVHRDIKPANIMLDNKENVKVTDFGLAKPSSGSLDITQPGLVVGTPTYMSPEQGAGEDVDTTSDIYSLGVVLYEMLTGRVPFHSDNVGTIIYKHLHEAPEPPTRFNPDVDSKLEAIVLKCLGKHPQDRYRHPGELVAALEAFLKGETITDATMMLTSAGIAAPLGTRAPRPSDVTLPTPTPVPVPGRTPSSPAITTTPAPSLATPVTIMQPVQPRKSRAAMTGFLAALLLVAAAGAGFHYWPLISRQFGIESPGPAPGPHVQPGTAGKPDPRTTPTSMPTGPHGKLHLLTLKPLEKLLPAGSSLELVTSRGTTKLNPERLTSLRLPAGEYQLNFARKGYQPETWQLTLSATGVTPALQAKFIVVKPTAELTAPYTKAQELLATGQARDALDALQELKQVAEIDPHFRETATLRKSAAKLISSAEARWKQELRAAEKLETERKWNTANSVYQKLARETPIDHRLHDRALSGLRNAKSKIARISGLITALKGHLRKGEYDKAGGVNTELRLVSEVTTEIKQLSDALSKGTALWKQANDNYNNGRFDAAATVFTKVLALSPECTAARTLKSRCEKLVTTTNKIERSIGAAEGQFKAGNHAGCLKVLDGLAGEKLGEFAKQVAALRARAQQGLETGKIGDQLTRFDSAFVGLDFEALKKEVLDFRPASSKFVKDFQSQFNALANAGIEVSASRYALKSVKVERSAKGAPLKATANAAWNFEMKMPGIARTVTGSIPMLLTFSRVADKWLLAAATPAGKPTARSAGKGPARSRITGKIIAIAGKIVTIDRGTDHGVSAGMTFNIFQEARVVHLPLTSEKLFVEERPVAIAEVINVTRKTSRCALAPATTAAVLKRLKPGLPVALSPAKSIARSFPVLTELTVSAQSASAGETVTATLGIKPLRGVFVTYKWSATGGLLASEQTSTPRAIWRAPAAKGDYRVTVTVMTPAGRSEARSVTVKSTGTPSAAPKNYSLEATICAPELLESCADVAFDSRGYAYALDTRKRLVLFFDPQFRPMGASARFESSAGFARIAVHAGRLFCLDTKSMSVKAFDIGQTIQFSKRSGREIGGRGTGNGKFAAPVDLAFSRAGELYVLDAPPTGASVQVFSRSAEYLQSFGSPTRGDGRLEKPVALVVDSAGVVHVLDAQRRKVVSFRNGRPLRAFACGPKTAQLTDIAYDVTTDSLIVLDSASGQASVYGTSGTRRAYSIGSKAGLASLRGATRIAANGSGSLLAVTNTGKLLSRFSTTAGFRGLAGGSPLSASCKIASGPRETLLAVDTSTSIVRVFDRNGWMLSEFGGRKVIRKAADLVCDARGIAYVLDAGTQNVKAFDLAGRPQGTYGKKGKPPAGMKDVVDIATDGKQLLAVLCYQPQDSIFQFALGARGRPSVFPSERRATNAPKALAIDSRAQTYVLNKKGQVTLWSAQKKNLGVWPITFRSGEDLAASAGRVFVLDSRTKLVLACDEGGRELARIKLPKGCQRPADIAPNDYEVVYLYDSALRAVLKYRANR